MKGEMNDEVNVMIWQRCEEHRGPQYLVYDSTMVTPFDTLYLRNKIYKHSLVGNVFPRSRHEPVRPVRREVQTGHLLLRRALSLNELPTKKKMINRQEYMFARLGLE